MRHILLPILALLLLTSCIKNEFTVDADLRGGGVQNLYIAYRAANSERSFVAEQAMPLSDGKFSLKGVTRYPTVMWIMSPARTLLYTVYIEHGDDITIRGNYDNPAMWQIEGNDVMEEYSAWAHAHEAALRSGDPARINTAVAAYVRKHPDNSLAAFLLLSHFARQGREKEFNNLWGSLKDTDKAVQMRDAFMALPTNEDGKAAALPLMPLSLPTAADTLMTVNPSGAKGTMLYFWHEASGKIHARAKDLLCEADTAKGLQGADIFMDADTVQWLQTGKTAGHANRNSLWALGGETNLALRRLGIPSTPFIIVSDSKGRQLYRGCDVSAARRQLMKLR